MWPPRALPALLLLVALAAGQIRFRGSCPQLPAVQKFRLRSYLGHWFDYAHYFARFQRAQRCIRAEYTDASDGRMEVVNRAVHVSNGKRSALYGQANPTGQHGGASLRLSFSGVPYHGNTSNYNVLDTDYKRYAIVWSCFVLEKKSLMNKQFLFILTRTRFPGRKLVRRVMKRLRKLGLNTKKLIKTDQKNCPAIKKPWFKKSQKGAILRLCSFKH